jgi:hypothetical protein
MIRYFLIFLLLLLLFPKIEKFVVNEKDIQPENQIYIPMNDASLKDQNHEYLLSNYFVINKNFDYNTKKGLLSELRDITGLDSHHTVFESPLSYTHKIRNDEVNKKKVQDYLKGKNFQSQIGYENLNRRIIYNKKDKQKFIEEMKQFDSLEINDPFKYNYRDPNTNDSLENKIIHDYSNSIDFDMELKEREQNLLGFRRPILDENNDFLNMSICMDIDGEGNDFDCSKYGLIYDRDKNFSFAKKDDDYSHTICCKSP